MGNTKEKFEDLIEQRKILSKAIIENVITAGSESLDPNARMIFVRDAARYIESSEHILEKTVDLLIHLQEQHNKLLEMLGDAAHENADK